MLPVVLTSLALVVSTTVIHYEVLRLLSFVLPRIRITSRLKLLIVMFVALGSHTAHILLFGAAFMALAVPFGLGSLSGVDGPTFAHILYFSAETYTSLGFGDVLPIGPIRLLAGVEALIGLLLIGWSASFLYISTEHFWNER